MKDQLRLLRELQVIDSRLTEIRKSMEALPERLRPAKQDLVKLEAMLEQERTQLAETARWRTEQEDLTRREEEAVRSAKSKLQQSRNTKDYAAATREIDNKRRMMAERQEEMSKVIEAMDQTRARLEQREKDVAQLREHVANEEATIATRVAELTAELASHEAGRGGLAGQVDKVLLRRYETVQRKKGIALVPVVGGVCKGCFMSLPPQLSNIIARGVTLESCPSCHRLLYRPEMLEDAPAAAGDVADEPPKV